MYLTTFINTTGSSSWVVSKVANTPVCFRHVSSVVTDELPHCPLLHKSVCPEVDDVAAHLWQNNR